MVTIPASDINKPYNLRQISQLSWTLGFLCYKNDFIELGNYKLDDFIENDKEETKP